MSSRISTNLKNEFKILRPIYLSIKKKLKKIISKTAQGFEQNRTSLEFTQAHVNIGTSLYITCKRHVTAFSTANLF